MKLVPNPQRIMQQEATVAHVQSVALGTLLTFDELHDLTGITSRTALYGFIWGYVNPALLQRKSLLVNVRGQGYKKAPAPDQMAHADQRRARGTRQFRKSVLELTHIDAAQLSPEERTAWGHQLQLANMRLTAARRRTLQAREHSRKAVVANEQTLADLAQAQEALEKVWKRIR